MAPLLRWLGIVSLALSAIAASGCGGDDADLGGNGRQACEQFNWRSATDGLVVCPGVSGCACGGGEVCCADPQGQTLGNARCSSLGACPTFAFGCDGNEDCASGQICCVFGNENAGGAECRDPKDCFFSSKELKTCRAEADCDGIESCVPADPGAFFDGLIARCSL
jgi:hypothetical protein